MVSDQSIVNQVQPIKNITVLVETQKSEILPRLKNMSRYREVPIIGRLRLSAAISRPLPDERICLLRPPYPANSLNSL